MIQSDPQIVSLENFRQTLLITAGSILSVTLLLAGVVLVLLPLSGLEPYAPFSRDYTFSGMLLLLVSILCGLVNVMNRGGLTWKAALLTGAIFALGVYFLFSSWLILGVLILLLSIFISSIFSNFQISTLVFMPAQILISAVLTWYALQQPSLSSLQEALTLPWSVYFVQISLIATLFFLIAMILLNINSQALIVQEELKNKLETEQKLLEQRVADQTRALDVTQEVNQLISTTIDPNQLIGDVVERIRQAFDYYHVQVYLFKPNSNVLQIAGGTGEAGTALLIGEHKLEIDEGVVGLAALTQATQVVDDVNTLEDWEPHSLLPDTVAEIAVPITNNEALIGVLDIQHNSPFEVIQRHTQVLEAIAQQIGTSVSNVSVFQQAAEQLRRNTILNEMALKLQHSADIHTAMEVVGEELVGLVDPVSVKVTIDPSYLEPVEEK